MAFITDPDDLNQGTEVVIDTGVRTVQLAAAGNLNDAGSTAADNGVTMQALYSFLKEEWKNDADLIKHPFPMVAISANSGEFEFVEDWELADATSEQFIRRAGFSYVDETGILKKQYTGFRSLGALEDATNDQPNFAFGDDPTDTGAAVDTDFPGVVDQAILTFEELGNPDTCDFATSSTITRATGSFITDGYQVGGQVTIRGSASNDGTYEVSAVAATTLTVVGTPFTTGTDTGAQLAVDNRNGIRFFLRVRDADPNGKTYSQADVLVDLGESTLSNRLFAFGLGNATDLKVEETDANITSQSPYTEILVRYLSGTYNREVDSTTKRDFGIVIDVGTYSQSNGGSATSTLFSSANIGDITLADYTGGTLIIHEGTDQGSHTIVGTPVNNAGTLEVTLSVALTATESNLSFTLQRATPVTATAEEIYEKVQYLLRQAADIDGTDQVVTGKTADELLAFVGDELRCGTGTPNNPNGGGSGVIIEGFDSNDTNRIKFTDNTGTSRNFPFVAAGNLVFNSFLTADLGPAEFFLFFEYTIRTAVSDLAISAPSGSSASIDSAGANLPALAQNDYIRITGATNEENNGIWQVTDASPTTSQFDATKVDGETVVAETAFAANVDQDPINSDDAVLVDDNSGADITGNITAGTIAFDFDYDGNVQGGRSAGTDAPVVGRAIGLESGQFVEISGTITRATGLTFSFVAAQERNYANP